MVGIFDNQHSMLINHLLLIFKFYIYSARNTKQLNFDNLKKIIKKTKELEKDQLGSHKLKLLNKWRPIDHIIDLYSFKREVGFPHFSLIFVCFFSSCCCFFSVFFFLFSFIFSSLMLIYKE